MKTCKNCKRYTKCISPCERVLSFLKNSKKNNGVYADTTHERNTPLSLSRMNIDFIDKILFTYGLSEIEKNKTRRIVVALLDKREIDILKEIAKDKRRIDIAKKFNLSQGRISQILKNIRKKINEQFAKVENIIY